MEALAAIIDFVSTRFKADLSDYWDGEKPKTTNKSLRSFGSVMLTFGAQDRTLITHFINPEGGSMAHLDCGALLQMGPTWGRHSEEWVLTFGFPMNDSKGFETDALPG